MQTKDQSGEEKEGGRRDGNKSRAAGSGTFALHASDMGIGFVVTNCTASRTTLKISPMVALPCPRRRRPRSSGDSASLVQSIAHTVTSTIVDGLVNTAAHWRVILLGQGVALVLAIAGASNQILDTECSVSCPFVYNVFTYGIIAIFAAFALKREEKLNKVNEIDTEEQERFQSTEPINNSGQDDNDVEDDDLTMDSETRQNRFSFRRSQREKPGRSGNNSTGSKDKIRTYPFLFGLFTIHAKWYNYFIVALVESQAYFLIFVAFRYTSFTFVYVSDALAIPSAMIFTKLIMKRGYLWMHLIGGAICMAGIVVNTASDMSLQDGLEHAASLEHIRGDLYAVLGAVLLGLDDVLSEILVTDYGGVTEMLFMKGLFGTLISILQMCLFEIDNLRDLFGANYGAACDISRRMALFLTHVAFRTTDVWGEMQFLLVSEAALLNLMLLTSDLYAALFDVIRVGIHLNGNFYAAFGMISFGIILYEAGPSPTERVACGSENTPRDIEFHSREEGSFAATEHTGNLGNKSRLQGELA